MASLPELACVTKLSPYVTRILGQNPSKFTLQGTNSYLVHHPASPSLLLVDTTGPSSSAPFPTTAEQTYLTNLRSAILAHPAQPARVTDIILTHWHKDHVGAVGSVLRMLAELHEGKGEADEGVRVWKWPCETSRGWAREEGVGNDLEQQLSGLRDGQVSSSQGGRVRPLQTGQLFSLAPSSPSIDTSSTSDKVLELEIVPTPGHTSDSICLALGLVPTSSSPAEQSAPSDFTSARSSSPPSRFLALFTADTILGHGTAVFASLSQYLKSLSKLVDLLKKETNEGEAVLYPGHGEVIQEGLQKVEDYKRHREEREEQVMKALKGIEGGKSVSVDMLVDRIYGTSIPESLKLAARQGLLLHLAKLEEEGRVKRAGAMAVRTDNAGEGGEGSTAVSDEEWEWV
ncbi:hypothetical protein JCM11641_002227 [Rhodosporidiobolus odoratus]